MSAVDVLAAREAHNAVIADAVRLLDDPEIRAAMDRHAGFSFDAATVHFRLLSTYVDFVKSDAAVAEAFAERDRLRNIVRSHEAQIIRMAEERAELVEVLDEAYGELLADSTRDGPRALLLTRIETALARVGGAK